VLSSCFCILRYAVTDSIVSNDASGNALPPSSAYTCYYSRVYILCILLMHVHISRRRRPAKAQPYRPRPARRPGRPAKRSPAIAAGLTVAAPTGCPPPGGAPCAAACYCVACCSQLLAGHEPCHSPPLIVKLLTLTAFFHCMYSTCTYSASLFCYRA